MADFDPEEISVGDLLNEYRQSPDRISSKTGKMPTKGRELGNILRPYIDKPFIDLFKPDENGVVPARKIVQDAKKDVEGGKVAKSALKTAMQNLRYLSVHLAKYGYDGDAPDFLIKENKTDVAEVFFGLTEPAKPVSSIQINPSAKTRKLLFKALLKHAAHNPADVPAVRALVFGMTTGLRPNAVLNLQLGHYRVDPDTKYGSIYIKGDSQGAKGNKISAGLNSVADAQLQAQLRDFSGDVKEGGYIFVREGQKSLPGKGGSGVPAKVKLTTGDLNKVLMQIRVPKLLYDEKNDVYYDSFKPDDPRANSPKFGVQLMRNYHTTTGRGAGVNDLVLAKLQGRSTKSYGKGSTGEMSTYDSAFPHHVTDYEMEQAEILARKYRESALEALEELQAEGAMPPPGIEGPARPIVDMGATPEGINVPERVTQLSEGWGDYYDRPLLDVDNSSIIEGEATVVTEPEGPKKLTDADNEGIKKKFLSLFKKAPKVGPLGIGMTAVGIAGTMSDVAEAQEISQMEDTDAASQQAAELGLSMTPGAFVQMGAETLMPSIAEDIKEEAETMTEEEFLGGFAADTFED